MALAGRRITVGVSGGIAAYKAAELVRLLVKEQAEVRVVMTPAAEQFITRLTMQALTGREAPSDLFDLAREERIGHIALADEAELLVVAPASADVIARLAAGMAHDLLTTVALATKAPLLLAPAMNVNMWSHPQTQANVARLRSLGARLVGPDSGDLACGWVGSGRLAEPPVIVEAIRAMLDGESPSAPRRDLAGVHVLVTAGPTHEPVDPVRYLGNRSSGKMGFAIAEAAAARGARVTLIAGPVALPTPPGVERVDVQTAREMDQAVRAREAAVQVIVKAAAVADFRPAEASLEKIKKLEGEPAPLPLVRNPDILAGLGERRRARGAALPVLVGFAAETSRLDENAQAKLARKGVDLIVGNDVSQPGVGFGSDDNQLVIYRADAAPEPLPRASKRALADALLDRIAPLVPSRS